ncbi:MAG: EcoKI restriction-modification system protein HsdS [bacterium ADurb.Bin243]|nr:MAG: EcoKI restriction-modification system protein HsdS [bacterium ADurb.Bin243]
MKQFKPYPEYKDSGVKWLGDVPRHWEVIKGKWLYKKMNRPVKTDDEVITCFRDGMVTLRKNRRLRGFTESIKEIGYQGIKKGDLVIHQMDAFAGAIGVSDSDGKGTPVYSVCQPKIPLNNFYYASVIKEMARSEFILSLAKGIRERSTDFRFDTLASLNLPVPSFDEQNIISRYLKFKTAQIAKFIKAKKRMIELLKEQKQAIINDAVTGKIDVTTGKPYQKYKDSGVKWLGQVPEGWKILSIRRLTNFVKTGGTPKNSSDEHFSPNGFLWFTPGDLGNSTYLKNSERHLSEIGIKDVRIFPENTIYFVGIGATIGKVGICKDKASCNQQINAMTINFRVIDEYFIYSLLSIKHYILKCGKFTTLPIINQEDMKQLKLLVPSQTEQNDIIKFINHQTQSINITISRIEREISLMQEFRSRLISDVVTGKIDVRGIEVPEVSEESTTVDDLNSDDSDESSENEVLDEKNDD